MKDLQSVKDCIENIYRKHVELCEELVEFCERYKTVESLQAANTQQMISHGCRILVETALRQADTRISDFHVNKHQCVQNILDRVLDHHTEVTIAPVCSSKLKQR